MLAAPICPIVAYAGETMVVTGFGILVGGGVEIYQKEFLTGSFSLDHPIEVGKRMPKNKDSLKDSLIL